MPNGQWQLEALEKSSCAAILISEICLHWQMQSVMPQQSIPGEFLPELFHWKKSGGCVRRRRRTPERRRLWTAKSADPPSAFIEETRWILKVGDPAAKV